MTHEYPLSLCWEKAMEQHNRGKDTAEFYATFITLDSKLFILLTQSLRLWSYYVKYIVHILPTIYSSLHTMLSHSGREEKIFAIF